MSHALQPIAQCEILHAHPLLTLDKDGYRYRITTAGGEANYEVTDGVNTIHAPIEWAFGLGDAGQTYVFQRNGSYFESRVSFYRTIKALDLTIGATTMKPANLEEAAGRIMAPQEAAQCFGCHSTNAVRNGRLDLSAARPGVQCERCHQGAERHALSLKAGNGPAATPPRLSKMTTEEMSNFCGQCHRTWAQIAAGGPRGLANVRFQPYRLANSKCYDVDDARIQCTACHDPHGKLETSAAGYDAKCQACHATPHAKTAAKAKACPVASSGCANCHMPKLEIPGSHQLFTDHQIRVARNNAPYPN